MNQRIKELAEQAYDDLVNQTGNIVVFDEDFQQRFAELIIQECAITVIDRCEMRNADDVRRAEYHAKRIKQHFGVEE